MLSWCSCEAFLSGRGARYNRVFFSAVRSTFFCWYYIISCLVVSDPNWNRQIGSTYTIVLPIPAACFYFRTTAQVRGSLFSRWVGNTNGSILRQRGRDGERQKERELCCYKCGSPGEMGDPMFWLSLLHRRQKREPCGLLYYFGNIWRMTMCGSHLLWGVTVQIGDNTLPSKRAKKRRMKIS